MFFAHRYLGSTTRSTRAPGARADQPPRDRCPARERAAGHGEQAGIRIDCPDDDKARSWRRSRGDARAHRRAARDRRRRRARGVRGRGAWSPASNTQPALVIGGGTDGARLAEIRALLEARSRGRGGRHERRRDRRGISVAPTCARGVHRRRRGPAAVHRDRSATTAARRRSRAGRRRDRTGRDQVGASGGTVGVGIAAMLSERAGTVANSPHLAGATCRSGAARRLDRAGSRGLQRRNAITWASTSPARAALPRPDRGVRRTGIARDDRERRARRGRDELRVEIATQGQLGDNAAPCACGQRGCVEAYVAGVRP